PRPPSTFLSLCLFFYSPADHPDLHSFPTRRSSDLYSLGMLQRVGIAAALLPEPTTLLLDEPLNGLDIAGIRWMRALLRRLADEGDRKSTRLNSSHVKISYAVFCLKKKKTESRRESD